MFYQKPKEEKKEIIIKQRKYRILGSLMTSITFKLIKLRTLIFKEFLLIFLLGTLSENFQVFVYFRIILNTYFCNKQQ